MVEAGVVCSASGQGVKWVADCAGDKGKAVVEKILDSHCNADMWLVDRSGNSVAGDGCRNSSGWAGL